ncbi:uncharacterized protein LOC123306545 isoform X1 [Coccinella septempunctata]|uniref:uncharacterized protein LOC123306545 isoform X1 n=1 Tax=Coccinella septempunctata TaxID=41139 RepID=UPI001D07522B|nr:uncharacterized protein LOC123306545 isoform X1 [Coccinella septempunctata]
MRLKCCLFVGFLNFFCFFLEATASSLSQDYALLPKIFYLNDTEECPDDKFYCKVDIRLKPKDEENPPKVWELITKDSMYRRDHVFRGFCIGEKSIEQKLEEELHEYNLTGNIIESYCERKKTFYAEMELVDLIIISFFMAHLGFIIYSTIRTNHSKNDGLSKSDDNKYLKMFSLTNTWREINNPNRNEHFDNLLSFQGMRTFGMVLVTSIHSILVSMMVLFVRNPEYFEEVPHSLWKPIFHGSFGLAVQIFFIMSAWLLSVQLHGIVKKNGEFTLKDLLLFWLNRYLRLIPSLLVILILHTSDALASTFTHPYYYSSVMAEMKRCRSIGWKNLFFIQNLNVWKDGGVCAPVTWYAAADFQLYILLSGIFYVSRKLKIPMKYFFGLIAFLAAFIQIFNMFTINFEGLVRFNPRFLPAEKFMASAEMSFSYLPTYGSAITYIIGFLFGSIYWHNRNKPIFDTMMKKLTFYAAFIGLPLLASYLTEYRPNRVVEAVLNPLVRPLFGLGIAVGLLGMATGSGGYIKKFFESAPMVFLGNFTYSTYLFHFTLVFGRRVFRAGNIEVDDLVCYGNTLIDVPLSFMIGIVFYMILEHPLIRLQKIFIPQISNRRKKEESKVE